MVKYNGINHVAMATRDIDTTIRFWRDLLGMRLIVGIGKPGYRHYFFQISRNDCIAFFEWPDVEPMPEKDHGFPVRGPFIFDHISLGVENEEDLWTLKDKLDNAGFWVSEIIDHGFIYSLYSFDPNGIPIEFSTFVSKVDVRKTPRLIDSKPTDVALEGPEPDTNRWPPVKRPTPLSERRVYPGEGLQLLTKRNQWQNMR